MQRAPKTVTQAFGLKTDDQQEDLWSWYREQVKGSLYLLCRGVIGFKDMTPALHQPICQFVQYLPGDPQVPSKVCGYPVEWVPEARKLLLSISREHFKSSICSVGHPIHLLINDPNTSILLNSAKEKITIEWLGQIKTIFERNQIFRWLFDDIIPSKFTDTKWDKTSIIIKRDESMHPKAAPSIHASSIESGQASGHFKHLINDDLINEKTINSSSKVKSARTRYVLHEALLDDWADSMMLNVGTPWGMGDVIELITESEKADTAMLRMGCWVKGKEGHESIFPERHPPERLVALAQKLGPFLFSCQYLCNPHDESQSGFNIKAFGKYIVKSDFTIKCDCHPMHDHRMQDMLITEQVDPAFSDSSDAARTAIVVTALASCECRFLLEAWAERVDPDRTIEVMTDIALRYVPFLRKLGIEAVAAQRIYKYWLRYLVRKGLELPGVEIVDLKPDTQIRKKVRIRGQQPSVNAGLWHVQPGMVAFLDEAYRFPRGDLVDLLDAWSYCDQVWEDSYPDTTQVPGGMDPNEVQQRMDQAARHPYSGYN